MEQTIIGREEEIRVLRSLLDSDRPELLALYGRRRVGKTFLIREFFDDKGIFFGVTGSKETTTETHRARFCTEMEHVFYDGRKQIQADTWDKIFDHLRDALDNTRENNPRRPVILFIDELPWLAKSDKTFLGAFDHFWNVHLSRAKYAGIIVIICGSAAAWMVEHIINDKGGLHNRVTAVMRLMPFTLAEVDKYLRSRGVILEHRHILELYMAMGGIPHYLSMIQPGLSAAQNINELCFRKDGFLATEFERLLGSLFDSKQKHGAILRTLGVAGRTLDRTALLKASGIPNGGDASVILQELEEAGFILKTRTFSKKSNGFQYRLYDEYTLFYLRWIEPVRTKITTRADQNHWMQKMGSPSWNAWAGHAFEGICLKHAAFIKGALGISGVLTYESAWRFIPTDGSEDAQIDLLIERADRVINLVEIKFTTDEIALTLEHKNTLSARKDIFKRVTKTRSLVLLTMLTTYGVKKNQHYIGTVDNQLTMESLF